MTWEISDEDFDEQWSSLESPYRRRIAALAHSGRSSDDPHEAALVLALARRRLHPLELWGPIIACVIAYAAIAQLFLGGAEALTAALIVAGLVTLSSIRRGRLETAVERNEEVVANAPPPEPDPPREPADDDEPDPAE